MSDTSTTIAELRMQVRTFVEERQWEPFHTPKDLAIALSIEAAELMERFLWRPSVAATALPNEDRAAAAEELADVLIYGLSLANVLDVDVAEVVLSKLAFDARRYPVEGFRGRAP